MGKHLTGMIRRATPVDIPALHRLVESAYRGQPSRRGWTTEADLLDGQRTDPDALATLMTDANERIMVWERAGELIACYQLTLNEDGATFGMYAVSPPCQNGGYGKALLKHAESTCVAEWGVSVLRMHVLRQRSELLDYYLRRGYTNTGRTEPFPYGNPRFGLPKRTDLEFVVLEKRLISVSPQ